MLQFLFYRRLGIDLSDSDEDGHIEATLVGGIRFMIDTVELVKSFDPSWTPPSGGHRIALAFLCESPAEVDTLFRRLVDEEVGVHKEPWDAFWGQRDAEVKDPELDAVLWQLSLRRRASWLAQACKPGGELRLYEHVL